MIFLWWTYSNKYICIWVIFKKKIILPQHLTFGSPFLSLGQEHIGTPLLFLQIAPIPQGLLEHGSLIEETLFSKILFDQSQPQFSLLPLHLHSHLDSFNLLYFPYWLSQKHCFLLNRNFNYKII